MSTGRREFNGVMFTSDPTSTVWSIWKTPGGRVVVRKRKTHLRANTEKWEILFDGNQVGIGFPDLPETVRANEWIVRKGLEAR